MRIMLQSFTHFIYSVLFGVLATFGINLQTEQPHYKVIDQIGNTIEIRQYPKRTAAEIALDAEETDNPRREAFHALAGYIFLEATKGAKTST